MFWLLLFILYYLCNCKLILVVTRSLFIFYSLWILGEPKILKFRNQGPSHLDKLEALRM